MYGTYRHTHRFCLHGATGDFYIYTDTRFKLYDDESDDKEQKSIYGRKRNRECFELCGVKSSDGIFRVLDLKKASKQPV